MRLAMLRKEDAIRKEPYFDRNGKNRGLTYYFKCIDCDTKIKSKSSGLKKHSGRCVGCARRNVLPPYRALYNILKTSSAKRGIECTITYEDFLFLTQIRTCCYCGGDVEWQSRTGRGSCKYNLDRKDSSRGYSFDNIVVCCSNCNQMKREWLSFDEFRVVRRVLDLWREGDQRKNEELMLILSSWHDKLH